MSDIKMCDDDDDIVSISDRDTSDHSIVDDLSSVKSNADEVQDDRKRTMEQVEEENKQLRQELKDMKVLLERLTLAERRQSMVHDTQPALFEAILRLDKLYGGGIMHVKITNEDETIGMLKEKCVYLIQKELFHVLKKENIAIDVDYHKITVNDFVIKHRRTSDMTGIGDDILVKTEFSDEINKNMNFQASLACKETSAFDKTKQPWPSLFKSSVEKITAQDSPRIQLDEDISLQAIRYTEESPFANNILHMNEHDRIAPLDRRLTMLIKASKDFCHYVTKLQHSSERLIEELRSDWTIIEEDVLELERKATKTTEKDTEASLNTSMSCLADAISAIATSGALLTVSLDELLVKQLESYKNDYIIPYKKSKQNLQSHREQYESFLHKLLSRKTIDINNSQQNIPRDFQMEQKGQKATKEMKIKSFFSSMSSKFSSNTSSSNLTLAASEAEQQASEQADEEKLRTLRKTYELARFDHIASINTLRTHKRQELMEIGCAAFYAFTSYFHSGHENTKNISNNINSILAQISLTHILYKDQEHELLRKREFLLEGLEYDGKFDFSTEFKPLGDPIKSVFLRGRKLPIEKQSYLRKLSTNIKKDWKRRWFALRNGSLIYYRNNHDLKPQFVVNVMICTVRPNYHYGLQYVFDIVSPNRRIYTLQAENEDDFKSWLAVFQNCTEALMVSQNCTSEQIENIDEDVNSSISEVYRLKNKLFLLNPFCADCKMPEPDWASINLGILICIKCSGVHRFMGVHISKVRSLNLDSWEVELLQYMLSVGNDENNVRYEGGKPVDYDGITEHSGRDARTDFIQDKYQLKAFLDKTVLMQATPRDEHLLSFLQAAKDNNLKILMDLFALGANIDWQHPVTNKSVVHISAENGNCVCLEFSLQNNGNLDLVDNDGNTPLESLNNMLDNDDSWFDERKIDKELIVKCKARLDKLTMSGIAPRARAQTNANIISNVDIDVSEELHIDL